VVIFVSVYYPIMLPSPSPIPPQPLFAAPEVTSYATESHGFQCCCFQTPFGSNISTARRAREVYIEVT
jgi:hypothetical protein